MTTKSKATRAAKASVIAPPESLQELELAPRNKQTFEAPAPEPEAAPAATTDEAALRSATVDAAQSINPANVATPEVPAALQSDPVALLEALLRAGYKLPGAEAAPAPAPVAPVVQPRRLVTSRVVAYLHALSEIDADQFGKKLDDLTEMLVARSRARTEDARRLQDMTAAMHIYQEFEELWLKGSQTVQPR